MPSANFLDPATDMRWLAVRCCCQPTKVLGFLQVPSPQVHDVIVHLPTAESKFYGFGLTWDFGVSIEIRDYRSGMHAERAVYSDDRPIDFWRGVRGFVEAPGAPDLR